MVECCVCGKKKIEDRRVKACIYTRTSEAPALHHASDEVSLGRGGSLILVPYSELEVANSLDGCLIQLRTLCLQYVQLFQVFGSIGLFFREGSRFDSS